ncbi:MAG: response regulator [Nitrospirota bacterium]
MSRKLLLADDSITIQKVVEIILADEGFEIKTANNGEEALSVIPSFEPDIVLADIEMPKINGYQLCEKIKEDPSFYDMPVILLAGAFEPIDEDLLRQVRADDFIIKPFESQVLVNKINAVLEVSATRKERKAENIEAQTTSEELETGEEFWEKEEIPVSTEVEEFPIEEVIESEKTSLERAAKVKIAIPEEKIPSHDKLKDIFEKAVNEKISSLFSSLDVREIILESVKSQMRDSIEKISEIETDSMREIFEKVVNDRISSLIARADIKSAVVDPLLPLIKGHAVKVIEDIKEPFLSSLVPLIRDSVEKTMGEVTPGFMKEIFEKIVGDKISSLLASLEMKEILLSSLMPLMKDSVERLTAEIKPELPEILRASFESLTKNIEKTIWQTIHDAAEKMVSKEIERIRSEF